METVDSRLLTARAEALLFYSPYNFLRAVSADRQQELFGMGHFARLSAGDNEVVTTMEEREKVQLLHTELPWDSEFFGTRTVKFQTALFEPAVPLAERVAAVRTWQTRLAAQGDYYCFGEIPTEDTKLLQTLTASGWRLVETRLLFYHDNLAGFEHPRYPVRPARLDEANLVGEISATARNNYDRFHADTWFGEEKADAFLARYASAAVQGYCDTVLVPNEPGLPVDSFLAISDLHGDAEALGIGLSRVVLTAVGPQNRGWHLRLVAETVQRARANAAEYVLMTTQATNRAVFRTSEKLGFKLGGSTHILACHGGPEPT